MDEDDLIHERAKVDQKLRQRPRSLTVSAKTGRSLERVLREALALADRATNASRPRSSTAGCRRRCRPASRR